MKVWDDLRRGQRVWQVGDTLSEVKDAREDLVKETVGAMEITEDYFTYRTAVIHMLTHVCAQRRYTCHIPINVNVAY